MTSYGAVAITGNAWINERAQHVLDHGLRRLPPRPPSVRSFNSSLHPHDPRNGEFISTGRIAKAVIGVMTQDAFFAAHGEEWEDQYGSRNTLQAILWSDGRASLYRDLPRSNVQVFADIDSRDARKLARGIRWAADRPESGVGSEQRAVRVAENTVHVGYSHDVSGDLSIHVEMPDGSKIDMPDLAQVGELVDDLDALADALDGQQRTALRHFDPTQPRNPHTGEWVHIGDGINVPDLGGVFDLDHFEKYEELYHVSDESKNIVGFTAISMKNGEAQIAFDTDTHRYVLADTDAPGLRDVADTLETLLDEYENRFDPMDGTEYRPGDLVDYFDTADGAIRIGFDQAGDFKITATDSGNKIDFPELNPDQVRELIDALHEQADNAEENEE